MIRLVKIFDEHVPVVRGKGQFGRYDQLFEVVKKSEPRRLELEDLVEYVEGLRRRYPTHEFRLREVELNGRKFHVIDRKSWKRLEDGRRVRVRDRIPIYVDLERQEFYVPQSYLKRRKRLANYIIMRTLGALGVSRVRYVKTVG
ncbi:MAG: hypothetical protein DRP01_01910 [Archaeoglobales archaeon]|nr:MAG: hypothetical protein DRP01_01910 [Archaeoglobales archaeon]